MFKGMLGRHYHDGEVIFHQGELGDCMYVVQKGEIELIERKGDREFCLAVIGEGEFFGEAALFEKDVRSTTARAVGETIVLTLEKRTLLRRIHQEPSFAFMLLRTMTRRMRQLEKALIHSGSKLDALDSLQEEVPRPDPAEKQIARP